jgi:cysteine synthase A
VVEASSGSTAVSEAYFARLIGLPFVAVMTSSTSREKVELIEWYGGRCHFVDEPGEVYDAARALAEEVGGHYLDQFTYAERATDWRGNNNIAMSIFEQMSHEPHPVPTWVVVSAGTGGTSATIGRYLRYKRLPTRLLVADPEGSAFYQGWLEDSAAPTACGSRIEGIGRPRVEPSFVGGVVDDMVRVPDAASIATMRWVTERLGRRVGPSTGTNVWAALGLITDMHRRAEAGSVVTLLCDTGERYLSTYYDDGWLAQRDIDLAPHLAALADFDRTGLLLPV